MADLLQHLLTVLHTGIAVVILGIVASFSPMLYTTHIATLSTNKKHKMYSAALMGGVTLALIGLIITFQIIQVSTLEAIISSTSKAIIVGVTSNVLIGLAFIAGGTWYLTNPQRKPKASSIQLESHGTTSPLVFISLGFVRTFMTVSGVGATYLAATAIADQGPHLLIQSLLTVIFLLSALIPFAVIALIVRHHRSSMTRLLNSTKLLLKKLNYQKVIAIAAITFGTAIVIINGLSALFIN